MVQLEIVVDVVGTVGEGTEVAMVGMLAPTPGLALTLLCPELTVTCDTEERGWQDVIFGDNGFKCLINNFSSMQL